MTEFQSTLWTVIRKARAGGETAATDLVAKYRAPVRGFLRRQGFSETEADDLSQEVFLRVFGEDVLAKADPAKGRFRSLILAVTRHVAGRQRERDGAAKRGGGRPAVPLDPDSLVASRGRDLEFDREWVANLIDLAFGRLERENRNYAAALRGFLLEQRSYREIASSMGKSEDEVKNYVFRGRRRLVEILHDEIRSTASSGDEYEEEVRYLSGFLKK